MFRKETYTPKFKKRFLLGLEIILYLVGIGLLIQVFFVGDTLTNTFDTEAAARLIITKEQMQQNTTTYQNWIANTCDDVCAIQLFTYYLFNITNPEQVRDDGQYPQLTELGPFVFNRYEIRTNVKFSNDGTMVSYKYEYKYILNEELTNMSLWNRTTWNHHNTYAPTSEPTSNPTKDLTSNPIELNNQRNNNKNDDPLEIPPYPPIYILNPFMLAAFASCRMSNDGEGGGTICNGVGFADKEQFYFSNYSIQTILQNGMHSQTSLACNLNPLCNLTQKYIADEDLYVSEYTGAGNRNHMRELITFYNENQTYAGGYDVNGAFFEFWEEREYFETLREPKQWAFDTIESDSILNAFMMDKYRSVRLIGNGTFDVAEGLTVNKFIIDPKEYLSAENNTENAKYYQNGGIHDGLLNVTTTNGADVLQYTSKPYFLDAPYYVEAINNKMGLRQPNRSRDDTYFAIDNKLGTVLSIQTGYQMSFAIYPCKNCGIINPFRNIPEVIVPQFYAIVTGGAPPAALEQYKSILALLDTTTQYSVYAGPAVALCCFVIALYLSGRRYCKYKRNHAFTFYMDHDDESYMDQEYNANDDQLEYNAEDHPQTHQKHDRDDSLDDSIFQDYARRDDDDPMAQSMDKSMRDNDEKWKNKQNTNNKKQTSKSKLLSKITSKMDTYSS